MRAAAIAVSLLLIACQPKPVETPDEKAAEAATATAVTALVESWAKARTDGEWDALAALYADNDDFIWVERGQVRYATHAAAVAGFEGAKAAASRLETHVSDIVVTPLASDAASFRARVTYKLDYGDDAPPVDVDALLTGVAVDYDTGWKLLQGHFDPRTEPPPTTGGAERAETP